jgi:hypothetical protein
MKLDDFTKEQLWQIIVDTAHASVMYPTHKSYTRDVLLKEKAALSAEELASKLNMPLGEALVILQELSGENKTAV